MALSWIFGAKKKEEKPVTVTVEAVEVGSDEDYMIIQANSSQMNIYPQVPPVSYPPYTPLPYTVLPQQQAKHVRSSVQNQLEGVPFVLSPILEKSSGQNHLAGLEDLRRGVFQIAADINDSFFNYDFKLEYTIMQETVYHEN